jgi:hypothetical protein
LFSENPNASTAFLHNFVFNHFEPELGSVFLRQPPLNYRFALLPLCVPPSPPAAQRPTVRRQGRGGKLRVEEGGGCERKNCAFSSASGSEITFFARIRFNPLHQLQ